MYSGRKVCRSEETVSKPNKIISTFLVELYSTRAVQFLQEMNTFSLRVKKSNLFGLF